MDPARLVQRLLERPIAVYAMAVLDAYGKAAGGLLANGLAFAALFAVIPIALVTLGLAGSFLGDEATQQRLADALVEIFPPLESLIDGALDALASGAWAVSVLGLVGLLWTVSQFYVTLDVAFARIFATEPERDVVGRTVRGFVWVAVLLVIVIAVIVLGTLTATAAAIFPSEIFPTDVLLSGPVLVAITMVVVAAAYRILPPRTPTWRAVIPPAILVGLAILVLTQLFMFLAPRLVGIAALAGSLAAAFIALAWFSFTFQALLYGAAWVRVRDERRRAAEAAASGEGSGLAGPAAPAEPGGGGE